MLTHVDVYTQTPGAPLLPLSVDGIETDSLQVRKIDGLGPVKASINTSPFGSVDGESYHGSSVSKRNIVLILGYNPDWSGEESVESLRNFLYAYFTPKTGVKLRFFSTLRDPCEIEGWVESCEPTLFSKDPEMQVSIICPLPYFVDVDPTIVVDDVVGGEPTAINYMGTIETGFVLEVKATAGNPSYTGNLLIESSALIMESVLVSTTVDGAQFLQVSTIQGKKHVWTIAIPGGEAINILSSVSPESGWPQLFPGINNFSVSGTESGQEWTLTYHNKYGGL